MTSDYTWTQDNDLVSVLSKQPSLVTPQGVDLGPCLPACHGHWRWKCTTLNAPASASVMGGHQPNASWATSSLVGPSLLLSLVWHSLALPETKLCNDIQHAAAETIQQLGVRTLASCCHTVTAMALLGQHCSAGLLGGPFILSIPVMRVGTAHMQPDAAAVASPLPTTF